MEKFFLIVITLALGVFSIALAGLFIGFPLMWLWNWLMPAIFGLPVITFWQAVGLYTLSGALVKSTSSSSSK